jgi:hypothetical protein
MCLFLPWSATVTNNTFTAQIDRPLGSFMEAGVETTSGNSFTITGNTFTATGNAPGSRSTGTTYPVHFNAIVVVNATADVSHNQMTNVFKAIGARASATVTATDNVIQTTFSPFEAVGTTPVNTLTANWNDVSDYVVALVNAPALITSASNLRCNWWGQATGPLGMPAAVPASVYTPFATAPVAGVSHTGCTP